MRVYGLIGYPLSHSFSRNYFGNKFQKDRISDCVYENFQLAHIESLGDLLTGTPALCGLNITIPYKESVIAFLTSADDQVKTIGACNCVKIAEGERRGFNTDIFGFEKSLLTKLQPTHKKALILGTGGASKAVAFVLERQGIDFTIVSRTPAKGQIVYEDISLKMLASHLLVINTSPVGMFPNIDTAPTLPYEAITSAHFFFDLIYNPAETKFLLKAKEKGAIIQNGYDMLVNQAEESWRIWNDPNC